MFLSLGWYMCLDTPVFHYITYLINDHDFIPYQDILDNNVPGTYLFHSIMTHFIGYGDFAFRCFDITILLLLFLISWLLLKKFGTIPAFLGVILFGLHYLNQGPNMSLQRDFLCILPISLAFLWVTGPYSQKHLHLSGMIVGALSAAAASLKPSFCIGAIPLILYLHWEHMDGKPLRSLYSVLGLIRLLLSTCIGFIFILAIPVFWVYAKGGLSDFIITMKSYIPLYTKLNGHLYTIEGSERWIYYLKSFLTLGQKNTYSVRILLPAALGVFLAIKFFPEPKSKKKFLILLVSLCVTYSFYPLSQGKFWTTHYLPMQYFLILCASLNFVKPPVEGRYHYLQSIAMVVMAVFIVTTVRPTPDFSQRMRGAAAALPNQGRTHEIANYLESNMNPDDTVQPLDFVRGAVHAMLISRAKIATPFIYDLQFYHHISSPYIQYLRKQFILQMKKTQPRFVIRITERPWPLGKDTSVDFPELDQLLNNHYHIVREGNGYEIMEKNRSDITQIPQMLKYCR